MQELFGEWLSGGETREIVQAVREGEIEIEAGEGKPVDEAFADVRNKLGWTK